MQYVTVWDEASKTHKDVVYAPLESQEVTPVVPGGSPVWVEVGWNGTRELRFGFLGGGLAFPNFGTGGEFIARACIEGKKVTLHLKGKVGAGASYPCPGNAFIFVLSGRLTPKDRASGSAGIWWEGQGVVSGADCRIRYKGDAVPPYYYLGIFWATVSAGPGSISSSHPGNCFMREGSYFTADIVYEAV